MYSASIREVQRDLANLLERVEHGEEIEVRRRKRPVARIVPLAGSPPRSADWSGVQARLDQIYGGRRVAGTTASQLVYDGRGER